MFDIFERNHSIVSNASATVEYFDLSVWIIFGILKSQLKSQCSFSCAFLSNNLSDWWSLPVITQRIFLVEAYFQSTKVNETAVIVHRRKYIRINCVILIDYCL